MNFTAHIRKSDKEEQTVAEHSMNVCKLSEAFSKKLEIDHISILAAVLHDVGKLNADFNRYIHLSGEFSRGEIDHSYAGAKYLIELSKKMDDWCQLTANLVARVIVSHHGIHDWIDADGNDYFNERISKSERYKEICSNITSVVTDDELYSLIEKASDELEKVLKSIYSIARNRKEFVFYSGLFERLVQSVLVDADRTDTSDFMAGEQLSAEYSVEKLWETMHQNISMMTTEFSKKTDPISKKRMDISDRCAEFAGKKRGIVKLIVPTGGGKTISSMRFAVEYCKRFGKSRIFYIAPFMSILEQNSAVIKSIVGDESVFLEHHSSMFSQIEEGMTLDEYSEQLSEYELRCERWDAPVIATTMVQFLNTLFSGRMSCIIRMHCLADSVIIIDEVQSVPIKCVNLFSLAMNFLAKICGSTIVLSSATQPNFSKLILDEESSMTGDCEKDFEDFKRTRLIPKIRTHGYTYDEAAEFCYEKYLTNGNLLLIVNTKKSARELYKRIQSINDEYDGTKAEVVHLSTSMCPNHRKETIERIRKNLNKKPIICISTQLVEAGVDISFKCAVRSLAGLDSAAQTAGRCNRNGECDGCCDVYLINISEENIGRLRQIKEGQGIAGSIVRKSGSDIDSLASMQEYFTELYRRFGEDELNYREMDRRVETTLYELLSLNKMRADQKGVKTTFPQAFATAGSKFEVIDSNTVDVIVPYNDKAKEIILDLNSDIDMKKEKSVLRSAQGYTVGLYTQDIQKLGNGIKKLKNGALALDERYYCDEYGVTTEEALMEVLMC